MDDTAGAIPLYRVVDAIEAQTEEYKPFLNTETGEILIVNLSVLEIEDGVLDDDSILYTELERAEAALAMDVYSHSGTGKYIRLPGPMDVDEYPMMESFCETIADSGTRAVLLSALHGRGAFRRFKEAIIQCSVRGNWFEFRNARIRALAAQWCELNGIRYS